jgi:hypothetical protein
MRFRSGLRTPHLCLLRLVEAAIKDKNLLLMQSLYDLQAKHNLDKMKSS